MAKNKKKGKTKAQKLNILIYLIAGLMLLAGVGVFSYPAVSNYLQDKNHTQAIEVYDEAANKKSQEEINKEWQKAKVYNENLAGDPVHDPFVPGSGYTLPKNYNSVLNIAGDGMMGYIEIPVISVKLPIYHSTTEEVLQKGVGHIESTSLPVGGAGTHCVLTGHTGLPSAELFTRLTEMQVGDEFYIHILDKTLAYKVCDINVVLPDELENLTAEKGKDYVTLVTCTPYGKNTHRLLVKGERTEYKRDEAQQRKSKKLFGGKYHYYILGIGIALGVLVIAGILIFVINKQRNKLRNKRKKNESEQ